MIRSTPCRRAASCWATSKTRISKRCWRGLNAARRHSGSRSSRVLHAAGEVTVTLLNMRTAAGPRLGVKQPRGILDVAAASATLQAAGAGRHRRPAAERQGRDAGDARARGRTRAGRALSAGERRAACAARDAPREDHHDGVQLPAARRRDRHADSGEPDPLQQVQQRAQSPWRHDCAAERGGEELRLRNRAGDRLRARVPQRVGGRRPSTTWPATAPATTSRPATCST